MTLAERLARLIRTTGPISLAAYMAEANAAYYTSRDPLGEGGDFITAPEVSQMFGEMIGLWLADRWLNAGQPDPVAKDVAAWKWATAEDLDPATFPPADLAILQLVRELL